MSIVAIIASLVGAVGLISLSILDDYHYTYYHDRFLIVFMYVLAF